MSVGSLPQSLIGPLGAAAAVPAPAKSDDDAAFSGVLDRIATGARADDLGTAEQPSTKGLGREKGKPAPPEIRPTHSQRDEETGSPTPDPAAAAAATIDLSALAQAAAGAIIPPPAPPVSPSPPEQQGSDAAGIQATEAAGAPSTEQAGTDPKPAPTRAAASTVLSDRRSSTGSSTATKGASPSAPANQAPAPPAGLLPGMNDGGTAEGQATSAANRFPSTSTRPDQVPPQPRAAASSNAAEGLGSDPRSPSSDQTRATGAKAAADPSVAAVALVEPDLPQPLPAASSDAAPTRPSNPPTPAATAAGPSKAGRVGTTSDRTGNGAATSGARADRDAASSTHLPSVAAASTAGATTAGPAAPSAATQQVLAGLQSIGLTSVSSRTQIVAPRAAAVGTISGVDTPRPTSSLKTLTIQLSPENLGAVSITMRLNAQGIDVQIAVANPHTLHLLDKDRHLLSAAIEAAGGSKDALGLVAASSEVRSAGGDGLAQPQQNGGGGQTAFSSNTSSDGRAAPRDRQADVPVLPQSDADDAPDPVLRPQPRSGDSLYV